MNFTEYLTQAAQHNTLTIDSGWGQGRTTFGGLSAALLLHKIQPQLSDDDVLRSLSVNFCGPLMTETECELSIAVTPATKPLGEAGGGKRLPYIKGLTPVCCWQSAAS